MENKEYKYDVAFSFLKEDENLLPDSMLRFALNDFDVIFNLSFSTPRIGSSLNSEMTLWKL